MQPRLARAELTGVAVDYEAAAAEFPAHFTFSASPRLRGSTELSGVNTFFTNPNELCDDF